MGIKNVRHGWAAFCFFLAFWLTACQTGNAPAGTADAATAERKGLAPQRVDIRGSIIMKRYNQGQVLLEKIPPASPELNPVERFFQEIRRRMAFKVLILSSRHSK